MSIVIIKLTPLELNLLTEEKILLKNSTYRLRKGENYGFYCRNYLYGLYRFKSESQKYYFLSKNHYRPLRIFGDGNVRKKFFSNPQWVMAAWKNRNYIQDHLLMVNGEDEERFSFTFYHHNFSGFKRTLTLSKNPEVHSLITQAQKLLTSHDALALSELQGIGSRLFELGGFHEIFPFINHRITYSPNPPSFPIEILYSFGEKNEGWIWRENPILYFHQPTKSQRQLHSFISFNTGEDHFMTKEEKTLKDTFKLKPYFSTEFITGDQKKMLLQAMDRDSLHLVAHGEETEKGFRFLSKNSKANDLLSLTDIAQLPQTPLLVFLSNCYSDHPQLRKAFFSRGTQTLITSQGPLFSENLPKVIGEFYHRLLTGKMTVIESYHILIKKLINLNDINAVKLRLHGFGKERFYSFKTKA